MSSPMINSPPAGSNVIGGQVFLSNGQPYQSNGQNVYVVNGQYSTTPAGAAPAAPPQVINVGGSPATGTGGLYNPGSAKISQPKNTRNRKTSVNSANYVPPEVKALQQISQIDSGLVPFAQNLQNTYAAQVTPAANAAGVAQTGVNTAAQQYQSLYNQYAQQQAQQQAAAAQANLTGVANQFTGLSGEAGNLYNNINNQYGGLEANAAKLYGTTANDYTALQNSLNGLYGNTQNQYTGLQGNYQNLYNQYLAQVNAANAGQLPPGVLREVQQDVRGTQGATGNYNGVAQAVQEGMTTGLTGYGILNQEQQNLANALAARGQLTGAEAGALTGISGLENAVTGGKASALTGIQGLQGSLTGSQASALSNIGNLQTGIEAAKGGIYGNQANYYQGITGAQTGVTQNQQALYQNQANYYQNLLNTANSYLQSGTTPYAYGTNYSNNAFNQSQAAVGGSQVPSYNPYASSAPAFSYINPNTGAEFAQGTTAFMNQGVGATAGSPDTSGQIAGSALGAVGSIAGAVLPLLFCWVAREVYGVTNPKWLDFRDWLLNRGPKWLLKLYARYGERFAHWLRNKQKTKAFLRVVMNTIIALDQQNQNHKKKDK